MSCSTEPTTNSELSRFFTDYIFSDEKIITCKTYFGWSKDSFINILICIFKIGVESGEKNRYCLIRILIWYYEITKTLYLFSSRIINSNQKSRLIYPLTISHFWFLALLIRKTIHICHIWLKYKSIPDWKCNK